MPLNFSENRQNIEAGRETALRGEVNKLKKLLEVKEKELKTALEGSSLKKEILRVREKLKSRSAEYEKIKETKEDKERKGSPAPDFEEMILKRRIAPTPQQVKTVTKQINDTNVRRQLTVLMSLALNKSIYYAVKVARKIGNAYLLDRFHDIIVNELYEDLVKKNKLRQIK